MLTMRVLKSAQSGHEIRLAEPTFDTEHVVSLNSNGVQATLFYEVLEAIQEIDLDAEDWFDGLQWQVSWDDLLSNYRHAFMAGDKFDPGADGKVEIIALADRLSEMAEKLRRSVG